MLHEIELMPSKRMTKEFLSKFLLSHSADMEVGGHVEKMLHELEEMPICFRGSNLIDPWVMADELRARTGAGKHGERAGAVPGSDSGISGGARPGGRFGGPLHGPGAPRAALRAPALGRGRPPATHQVRGPGTAAAARRERRRTAWRGAIADLHAT